jgi:Curli assembly protein CsgE
MVCCMVLYALMPRSGRTQEVTAANLHSSIDAPEYGGIVTREVLTSMGYNFYLKFSEAWQDHPDYEKYNILVKERPYPRGAGQTEILIVYADLVIVRQFLPRDWQTMTALAVQAANVVNEKIIEIEVQNLFFNDSDLAASGL